MRNYSDMDLDMSLERCKKCGQGDQEVTKDITRNGYKCYTLYCYNCREETKKIVRVE